MKTILLKLTAPLQSWGTDSHFETRGTDKYPSKSGIIGMIAAALGYRRDEDEKLRPLAELSFATRVDQSGSLLNDFQTVARYKPNGRFDHNYVTNRYYLQDARFLVALSSPDDALMEKIKGALERPYFPLSLGRRALPINPDYLFDMNDKSIMENLKETEWQADLEYQRHHPSLLDIWADSDLLAERPYKTVRDVPVSFTYHRTDSPYNHTNTRQYRFRSISYTTVNVTSKVR